MGQFRLPGMGPTGEEGRKSVPDGEDVARRPLEPRRAASRDTKNQVQSAAKVFAVVKAFGRGAA